MTHGTPQGLQTGYAYLDAGNPDAAREQFESILRHDPNHIAALVGLAEALVERDAKAAADTLDRAQELAPEDAEVYRIRAVLLLTRGKDREALKYAERAVELERFSPNAYFTLGHVHLNKSRWSEAEAAFRRALDLAPGSPNILAALSQTLNLAGRRQEAADLAEEAIRTSPDSLAALVARGNIALERGALDEAQELALLALRQNATDSPAIHLLVAVKARRNPVMGIWWYWSRFMGELGSTQARWGVIIGIWLLWQIFRRTALADAPSSVQIGATVVWLGFCVLTWVGPSIFKRMIRKELKQVELRNEF